MAEFSGKRIVITGGAGGIGVETARTMLAHGAHVVLVDIDVDRLANARETLGTRASPPGSRRSTRGIVRGGTGFRRCTGCRADPSGRPVRADLFDPNDHGVWNRAIAANLTNAYDLAVAFASATTTARPGAHRADQFGGVSPRQRGLSAIAAAKAGLVGLTRSLARRLAPDYW